MKALLLLSLLCIAGTYAFKENSLKTNKTPKDLPQFTNVCDECQQIVKRFAEAAKDPAKMATLKELLTLMCHETSYEQECRVFVSKLDLFIDKLLPYLKDAERICHRFRMCSNSKIDQFHRVGLLFARKYLSAVDGAHDLICEECQFAAHELQQVVDDRATQQEVRNFVSNNICSHLGQYRGSCDIVVEDFLPDLFQELHNLLQDSKQFCADLKLCTRQQVGLTSARRTVEDIKHSLAGPSRLVSFAKGLNSLSITSHPELAMSCLECKITVDALLIDLRTEDSIKNLTTTVVETVCPILPDSFNASCRDFLGMYGPTVINMTLYQFTSDQICIDMKCCSSDKAAAAIRQLSYFQRSQFACEACQGVSKFVEAEITDSVINKELVHGLTSLICSHAPKSVYNVCTNLAKGYLPLALVRLEQVIGNGKICKSVHAC